jgi:hypothetical protein
MARADARIIIEGQETIPDAFEHLVLVGSPKVGPADASLKKCISREKSLRDLEPGILVKAKAHTAWTMARGMDHGKLQLPYPQLFPIFQVMVDGQRLIILKAKELALGLKSQIKRFVFFMESDLWASLGYISQFLTDRARGTDMVQMSMSMKEIADFDRSTARGFGLGNRLQNGVGFITWIDQKPMAGLWAHDQPAVTLEGSYDQVFLEIH